MINIKMYENDVKFGLTNEQKAAKHIEEFLKKYLKLNKLSIKKYKNPNSVFDWSVYGYDCIVELKSRRNTIEKYPTQLIGQNKIRYGKTIMNKKKGYEVFYFYLLEGLVKGTQELYLYIDDVDNELEVRRLGNFARGDKSTNLCIVDNKDLIYCSTF